MHAIVTSQGRITIPAEIRKKLGIQGRTRFRITDTGTSIILTPIARAHISKLRGTMHKGKR